MPYNPCGAIVDYGRFRYSTDCRFFRDSDVTAKIVWYPALPDAVELPFPSAITQSIWDRDGDLEPERSGVGEVTGSRRVIDHMAPVAGADGTHLCGTRSDFEVGALYDPDRPPIHYRADGLPECCPGGEIGGIAWGGLPQRPPPSGGVFWGGDAGVGWPFGWNNCGTCTTGFFCKVLNGHPSAVSPVGGPGWQDTWTIVDRGGFGVTTVLYVRGPGQGATVRIWGGAACGFLTLLHTMNGSQDVTLTFPPSDPHDRWWVWVNDPAGLYTPTIVHPEDIP